MVKQTEEFKLHIGNRIRELREENSFTQEEIAKYVGCSRVQIVNLEAGRNSTTFEVLWNLCNAFHCTPNDIFPKQKYARRKVRYVEKTRLVPTKVKVKKVTLSCPKK